MYSLVDEGDDLSLRLTKPKSFGVGRVELLIHCRVSQLKVSVVVTMREGSLPLSLKDERY
jgi:hypothetical protein